MRDARLALALLADRFFDHPSRRMPVVGVTGTNGKTTTAYLLSSMLDAAGLKAGMLGTVAYRIGGEDREASRTTPEAPDVQQLLNEMLQHGCKSAVMEVSSHALSLKRVDGMRFAAAVFTNLTRDHLDFHEDMEAYFAAKRRLFEMLPRDAPGVINLDDPRGPALVAICGRPVTYAITAPADVTPGPIEMTLGGPALRDRHAARPGPRCARSWSASRTSTTSSPRRRPPWRSTCRSRRSSAASPASPVCPAASRWCRQPTMK